MFSDLLSSSNTTSDLTSSSVSNDALLTINFPPIHSALPEINTHQNHDISKGEILLPIPLDDKQLLDLSRTSSSSSHSFLSSPELPPSPFEDDEGESERMTFSGSYPLASSSFTKNAFPTPSFISNIPDYPLVPSRKTTFFDLYPGSHFSGEQISWRFSYKVEVEIQHVNLDGDYLCGYLHIKNLTKDHPSLTTFFEAEIIGSKHRFRTNKWDADEETDRLHWSRFPVCRSMMSSNSFLFNYRPQPLCRQQPNMNPLESNRAGPNFNGEMRSEELEDQENGEMSGQDPETSLRDDPEENTEETGAGESEDGQGGNEHQLAAKGEEESDTATHAGSLNDYVFMRWKERFLVPDHKVQTINGASFAGFYYICYHPPSGKITGSYFHRSNDRLQQLVLCHQPDTSFPSYEFR